jgi:hypothetical protein
MILKLIFELYLKFYTLGIKINFRKILVTRSKRSLVFLILNISTNISGLSSKCHFMGLYSTSLSTALFVKEIFLVIVNIQLMGSVMVWPKVFPFSGVQGISE